MYRAIFISLFSFCVVAFSLPRDAQAIRIGKLKLCMDNSTGVIKIRKRKCREQETALDGTALSALSQGAVGPAGPKGDTGPQGPAGITGQQQYDFVEQHDFEAKGLKLLSQNCPDDTRVVTFNCTDDHPSVGLFTNNTGITPTAGGAYCEFYNTVTTPSPGVTLKLSLICHEFE